MKQIKTSQTIFLALTSAFVSLFCLVARSADADASHSNTSPEEVRVGSNIQNLRELTPIGGIPLIHWTQKDGKPTTDPAALSRSATRMASVSTNDFKRWLFEIEVATGTSIQAQAATGLDALLALTVTNESIQGSMTPSRFGLFLTDRMSLLFKDDKFQPQVSDKLLHRLSSLKPEYVKNWKGEFDKVVGKDVNEVLVACLLLPIDHVFAQEHYSIKSAERYLARLRQVPHEAVQQWLNHVDKYKGSEIDAAANIILINRFFAQERFDRSTFNESVETAK